MSIYMILLSIPHGSYSSLGTPWSSVALAKLNFVTYTCLNELHWWVFD